MITQPTQLQTIHYKEITNIRAPHYRWSSDLKVKTQAEAVRFINDVGIALLFPGENMVLPDLWSAINGEERTIPKHHHDWALRKTWDWKDNIPKRKDAWYGKLVRGKPAFVAMNDLPAIYALSDNFGELDDYLEAYADGLLSKEGKDIYEVLLEGSAMSTAQLRKATGMAGGGDNARRFERAITELQSGFKIVKSGISTDNRWKYCYVYDLLLRWAPNLGEQARVFNSRTAMRHIITRYLQTSIAAPPALFPRLFGWEPGVTDRVLDEMQADGAIEAIKVVGGPGLTARAKTSPEGDLWVKRGVL
ncbi:MAG: crosslink repair DNA glycosylase YcaQ family protein [Chloroflexota bacterium]